MLEFDSIVEVGGPNALLSAFGHLSPIDLTKIKYAMVKEDGSLISSYTDAEGCIRLKTKGSLASDQAQAAMGWLAKPEQSDLLNRIGVLEKTGWTVNAEWTSPLNRIVVPYQQDKLIILNVRHRLFGNYMERDYMVAHFGDYAVPVSDLMVHDVAAAVGTEGIVAFFGNSADIRFMKVKADAYLILHRLKDGVNQPNALFEAVVHEQIDDLRASFAGDPAVQLMIQTMEDLVGSAYNDFIKVASELFEAHKHLDRKDFAIAVQAVAQQKIPLDFRAAFNVAMNEYIGRAVNPVNAFVHSAQARIVGQYKTAIVQALQEQNLNSGNLEIQ